MSQQRPRPPDAASIDSNDLQVLRELFQTCNGTKWRTKSGWSSLFEVESTALNGKQESSRLPTTTGITVQGGSQAPGAASASKNPFGPPVPRSLNPFAAEGDTSVLESAAIQPAEPEKHPVQPGPPGASQNNVASSGQRQSPEGPTYLTPFSRRPRKCQNPFADDTPTTGRSASPPGSPGEGGSPQTTSPMDKPRVRSPSPSPPASPNSAGSASPGSLSSKQLQSSKHLQGGARGGGGGGGSLPFGIALDRVRRVCEIRMDDNLLQGALPVGFSSLVKMRYLHMSYNQLSGPLPVDIGRFTALQWLALSNNRLSGPLPKSLGGLTSLVELNLSGNQLRGTIPEEIVAMENLQTLQLSYNYFTGEIPAGVVGLQRLEFLHLDHNHLNGHIPARLAHLVSLRNLTLDHNRLTGQIPPQLGRMDGLKVVNLSHNLLRGSIPEALAQKLGPAGLMDNVVKGNRLSDANTALMIHTAPLKDPLDRGLLWFSVMMGFLDVASDYLSASVFWSTGNYVSFALTLVFVSVPTALLVLSTLLEKEHKQSRSHRDTCFDTKWARAVLTVFQLRILYEAIRGAKDGRETVPYKFFKFLGACFQSAPQLLMQSFSLALLYADADQPLVVGSIALSVMSLAFSAASLLDMGWIEEEVERRKAASTLFFKHELFTRMLLLFLLTVYHICEIAVRGIALVLVALVLRGYVPLLMIFAWGVRVAIGRITEVSDLGWFKICVKALASTLLDSVWDNKKAYLAASAFTAIECFVFIAVSTLAGGVYTLDLPTGLGTSAVCVAAGAFGLRLLLDFTVRAPIHWRYLNEATTVNTGVRAAV